MKLHSYRHSHIIQQFLVSTNYFSCPLLVYNNMKQLQDQKHRLPHSCKSIPKVFIPHRISVPGDLKNNLIYLNHLCSIIPLVLLYRGISLAAHPEAPYDECSRIGTPYWHPISSLSLSLSRTRSKPTPFKIRYSRAKKWFVRRGS